MGLERALERVMEQIDKTENPISSQNPGSYNYESKERATKRVKYARLLVAGLKDELAHDDEVFDDVGLVCAELFDEDGEPVKAWVSVA